jgi:hypothetical protein
MPVQTSTPSIYSTGKETAYPPKEAYGCYSNKYPLLAYSPVLEFAIRECSTKIARLLLRNGANSDTVNSFGQTLPMVIVSLQILLTECPETFHALDINGGTTLHSLAYDGTTEELDFLIRCGGDFRIRTGVAKQQCILPLL